VKILHIVTLMSPDGAYGGPTRVAVNQASALTGLGYDVTIVAGEMNYTDPPRELQGVATQLFPSKVLVKQVGHAGLYAPGMRPWLARNAHRFDIAHIHLGRDMVTIPAAYQLSKKGIPFVLQTHGMVVPGSHRLAASIDRLFTVPLLRRASVVFYLNDRERTDLQAIGGSDVNLRPLDNGTPLPSDEMVSRAIQSKAESAPEVLFFARVHERKRPEAFAAAALRLLREKVRARFSIVGPAAGAESSVDRVIECARREGFSEAQLHREPGVPPDQALDRMSRAAVYVLPAVREPFGMTIIEALALRIPVVICRDGGLAPFVLEHDCGLVVDGSVQSLADAINTLLNDPARARQMGERGSVAVRERLSIERVGDELAGAYAGILGKETAS